MQVLWKVMRLKCAGGTFNLNGKNDELNPLFPFIPHTSVLLPNVGVALQMTESEGKKNTLDKTTWSEASSKSHGR